jgi:hypothetical protein
MGVTVCTFCEPASADHFEEATSNCSAEMLARELVGTRKQIVDWDHGVDEYFG